MWESPPLPGLPDTHSGWLYHALQPGPSSLPSEPQWEARSSGTRLPVFASVAAATAKSFQSCLTLYDPIDGSPPGLPIPGILQARTRVGCCCFLWCLPLGQANWWPLLPLGSQLPYEDSTRVYQAPTPPRCVSCSHPTPGQAPGAGFLWFLLSP